MLITILLVVFFIGSIIFYSMLKSASENEISTELNSRMEFILNEFPQKQNIYKNLTIPGYISVTEATEAGKAKSMENDTLLVDPSDNIYKQYRYISKIIQIDSASYRVTVYKSLIESNELIERITLSVTFIVVLFIVLLYLLNRFMFERVWSDFFRTLKKLKTFDVNSEHEMHFKSSEIFEFDQLNSTLNQMIGKIRIDYENMKEFTGNISHEIQTPLTIIRQKSELLLQTEPLTKDQLELISDIQQTTSRLARLNKILVLLSKIENKQIVHKENISVKDVVENHIENFRSIAETKKVTLKHETMEDFFIEAEPGLVDMLIVNLIKNAIYHNITRGEVKIVLEDKKLRISNTGEDHDLSGENIFERYAKFNRESKSPGLGLAIVNKVCNLYGYKISYQFMDKQHTFVVAFG